MTTHAISFIIGFVYSYLGCMAFKLIWTDLRTGWEEWGEHYKVQRFFIPAWIGLMAALFWPLWSPALIMLWRWNRLPAPKPKPIMDQDLREALQEDAEVDRLSAEEDGRN